METIKLNLNIPKNRIQFFLELIREFDFVQFTKEQDVYEGDSKEEILDGIKQAVKEMNLIKQGKLKARPAKDFLNEL